MSSPYNLGGFNWGYLINQDKSASKLLTDLCMGLVKIISQLEPGPDTDLTPQRLYKFYQSVGEDDLVFRELGYPGLSLMYSTLGCFHSLEPTSDAFAAPSVPCLLPPGFVRWQTQQLLLRPNEHAQCMQKAVELYDVPKPGGGHFPKKIPRESFPMDPDEEMWEWRNLVLRRLNEGKQRLKNSPYCSPHERSDHTEGYIARTSPQMRRTSGAPKTKPKEFPHHPSQRRTSEPATPPPIHIPEQGAKYHSFSDQAYSPSNSANPPSPGHRPSSSTASQGHQYHRGANSHHTPNLTNSNDSPSKSSHLNFDSFRLPFVSSPFKRREWSTKAASRCWDPPQSPPVRREAVSTGSDASSEDSLPRFSKERERDRRRSPLAPEDRSRQRSPLAPNDRSQRRHSHDASYRAQSLNPSSCPPQSNGGHNGRNDNQHPSVTPTPSVHYPYRENLFSQRQGASPSAPGSPISAKASPRLRIIDPLGRDRSTESGRGRRYFGEDPLQEGRAASVGRRSRSGGWGSGESTDLNKDHDLQSLNMRRDGRPLRVNTVASPWTRRVGAWEEASSPGTLDSRKGPLMSPSGGGWR